MYDLYDEKIILKDLEVLENIIKQKKEYEQGMFQCIRCPVFHCEECVLRPPDYISGIKCQLHYSCFGGKNKAEKVLYAIEVAEVLKSLL